MMSELKPEESFASPLDRGLLALCQIAAYYRVASDPAQLQHQLGLLGRAAQSEDIARGAKLLQLKARVLTAPGGGFSPTNTGLPGRSPDGKR